MVLSSHLFCTFAQNQCKEEIIMEMDSIPDIVYCMGSFDA